METKGVPVQAVKNEDRDDVPRSLVLPTSMTMSLQTDGAVSEPEGYTVNHKSISKKEISKLNFGTLDQKTQKIRP